MMMRGRECVIKRGNGEFKRGVIYGNGKDFERCSNEDINTEYRKSIIKSINLGYKKFNGMNIS